MGQTIVFAVAGLLFVAAFLTKRRFGVLGLGLAAGLVIAMQLRAPVAALLSNYSDYLNPFSGGTLATVLLVLLPALLLLAGGPKYHSSKAALIGASGFILLAAALTLEPLSRDIFWIEDRLRPILETLTEWQGLIVATGVVLAVVDMFMAHNPRLSLPKKHSKH